MLQIYENGKNANTEKTVDEKSKLYEARHVLFRAGAVQQAAASYYGIARFLSIISCNFVFFGFGPFSAGNPLSEAA